MTSNKPVAFVRYGRARATIWPNDTARGRRYTVTVDRLYKWAGEWKSSDSFWRDDIPLLIRALDEAYVAILRGLDSPLDGADDQAAEETEQ